MKFMNQKGQAFTTFQLLISAVIALAILVLLLNIIGGLPNLSGGEPSDEATNLVKALVNSPGDLKLSRDIVFRPQTNLTAKSIAASSGVLTEDQICVSTGDFDPENSQFKQIGSEEQIVSYQGSSNVTAKLSVICDTGKE